MYRVMGSIYWRSEALSQIPPDIATASKQGAVSQSRSEVVMVNAPSGDYVFCIITKNQEDTSWEYENEGYQLIRDVSKTIWDHYEPDHPYEPVEGHKKWSK
jgi:beta-lactamase class A